MNRKTTATNLCALLALAIVATLCTMQFAHATGKPEPTPTPNASAGATAGASAGATAGSSSAIDLSLMNAPTQRAGNSYALVGGSATPLPPGLCPKGDSPYFSIGWSFIVVAGSSTRTEMECLDKVLAAWVSVNKPAPQPVVNYLVMPEQPKAPEAAPSEPKACEAPPAKPAARPDPRKSAKVPKKAGVCT